MNQPLRQMVLFTPPRLAEERKAFWFPVRGGQPAIAGSYSPGIAGLGAVQAQNSGNAVTDVLSQLHNGFIDFVGTLTGQNAQAAAQQNAIQLAQLQQQQALNRENAWARAAPWLAIGGGVALVAVVLASRR